jgi:sec-independent protein translocase protein TatA
VSLDLSILLFGMPTGQEWFWILIVAVFLFGANKIPQLARSVGKGINEFKRGLKDTGDGDDDEPKPPAKPEGGN